MTNFAAVDGKILRARRECGAAKVDLIDQRFYLRGLLGDGVMVLPMRYSGMSLARGMG